MFCKVLGSSRPHEGQRWDGFGLGPGEKTNGDACFRPSVPACLQELSARPAIFAVAYALDYLRKSGITRRNLALRWLVDQKR